MHCVFQAFIVGLFCCFHVFCFHATSLSGAEFAAVQASGWRPLFNGKDLGGFTTYLEKIGKDTDPAKIFQVEDGVVHLYKNQEDGAKASRGYFATEGEFSHYHLRFQYKFGRKRFSARTQRPRDAGVMVQAAAEDKVWPRSVECQVQEGDTGDCFAVGGVQMTVAVDPAKSMVGCEFYKPLTTGGVEKVVGSKKDTRFVKFGTHENEGWNSVEVIVRGDKEIVHIVNGNEIFRGTNVKQLRSGKNDWVPLSSGRIVFQAEYAEVYYRNIEVKAIPDGPLMPSLKTADSNPGPVK